MIKKKCKEIFKVVMTSAIAIGMFSAGFMGINSLTLSAATSFNGSVPVMAAELTIPVENTAPQNSPSLSVYVSTRDWHHDASTNANALSAEEAAKLGAQYIAEMFGICLDGMVVEMAYTAWPSQTRTLWSGTIANSMADIENQDMLFFFTLDAVTGERIDVNSLYGRGIRDPRDVDLTQEEMMLLRRGYFHTTLPQQLDSYKQIAKDFAELHFQNTEVASIVFESAFPTLFERTAEGALTASSQILAFIVTDSTGREARVGFVAATGELIYVLTGHNDIVPGFRHDGPAEW